MVYSEAGDKAARELCDKTQTEEEFVSMIEERLKDSPPPNENYLTLFLAYAEFRGYTKALPILLENGAPINDLTVSPIGQGNGLPTDKAIAMYQSLIHAGWNVNRRLKYDGDVLQQAIRNDNKTLVQWLLEKGAQPMANNDLMEHKVLEHAVFKSSPAIVYVLIEEGKLNPDDCRALEYAAREGKLKTVQVLLDLGASVDRVVDPTTMVYINDEDTKKGFGSALHRAAEAGHGKIVRLLLDKGANPNLRDSKGLTPFDWAKKGLRVKIMLMLNKAMSSSSDS